MFRKVRKLFLRGLGVLAGIALLAWVAVWFFVPYRLPQVAGGSREQSYERDFKEYLGDLAERRRAAFPPKPKVFQGRDTLKYRQVLKAPQLSDIPDIALLLGREGSPTEVAILGGKNALIVDSQFQVKQAIRLDSGAGKMALSEGIPTKVLGFLGDYRAYDAEGNTLQSYFGTADDSRFWQELDVVPHFLGPDGAAACDIDGDDEMDIFAFYVMYVRFSLLSPYVFDPCLRDLLPRNVLRHELSVWELRLDEGEYCALVRRNSKGEEQWRTFASHDSTILFADINDDGRQELIHVDFRRIGREYQPYLIARNGAGQVLCESPLSLQDHRLAYEAGFSAGPWPNRRGPVHLFVEGEREALVFDLGGNLCASYPSPDLVAEDRYYCRLAQAHSLYCHGKPYVAALFTGRESIDFFGGSGQVSVPLEGGDYNTDDPNRKPPSPSVPWRHFSLLAIYDENGALIYQAALYGGGGGMAVLPGDGGDDRLLVGGNAVVWQFEGAEQSV